MTMLREIWIFLCRLSLVGAFVLAFAAIVFNVDLLTYIGQLSLISSAEAGPLHKFDAKSLSGLTLMFVIVGMVAFSFLGPTPPKRKGDKP
jgi:hypothetical protein